MFPFSNFTFPFSDYNKINLDWICELLSKLRGGNINQFLRKKSGNDYDFEWVDTVSSGVTSVNGQTGDVTLSIPTKTSQLTNNSGFITADTAPVTSVNSQTGDVVLTAADVGAGDYSLPVGGIPYSDLSSGVQLSLDAADAALPATDYKVKFFNSVTDLGLTSGSATIAAAVAALRTVTNAVLQCYATQFAASEYPNSVGNVRIWCTSAARPVIEFLSRSETVGEYVMYCDSDNVPTGVWVPLRTKYKDVTVTTSASGSVSPYTAWGSASASIGAGRHCIGANVIDSATGDPVLCNFSDTGIINVYSTVATTYTVRVLYL